MSVESDSPIDLSLSEEDLDHLTHQEKTIATDHFSKFSRYLYERGKEPKKNVGYASSSIRPIVRRVMQAAQQTCNEEASAIQLTVGDADQFIEALNEDTVLTQEGDPYTEGSKRKFVSALNAYFRFQGTEWESEITFSDNPTDSGTDPFTRTESEKLFEASIEYKSPPTYKNVSPEERDRWNAELAQYLNKPKAKVGPKDWSELQQSWKFPSLVSVSRDCASRAGWIEGLETNQVELKAGKIITPPEKAIKNNSCWENELSDRSITCLENWFEQRSNRPKYDDSDYVWLNREGNPYSSHNLNRLLRNLMDEAGIKPNGRILSWHSIRHSTGCYLYNQHKDLTIVADVLRQNSLEAAKRYAHPTPEMKKDAVEALQRGGL